LAARLADGDEHFVVTGASGWFGLTTLELLLDALGPRFFARRVHGFARTRRRLCLRNNVEVLVEGFDDFASLRVPSCHILHYAYPIRGKVSTLGIDRFARTTAEITTRVARVIDDTRPSGIFYTSAGPARGAGSVSFESEPYGAMKWLDELALRQVCRDAGTVSVIARVFSVSGPYLTNPHVYALADLIAQAMTATEIRVCSTHPVLRSYVAVADVVAIALGELLDVRMPAQVFDAAGEEVVEIGELADRVRSALGRLEIPIVRPMFVSQPTDDYVGDGSTMRSLAERHGIRLLPLDDQIRETAAAWS
jgi:nucleoside-diphosphate-sugar epimerase